MTAYYHTDIAAGAAATAATINAPLGQLDAKLNHTVVEYLLAGSTATTVTTGSTYYAVASFEVSFIPAYTGQVFTCNFWCGLVYSGTAGNTLVNLRVVDAANATQTDFFYRSITDAVTLTKGGCSVTKAWTAAAGDVGVTRKFKLYVSHTVNAASVTVSYGGVQAVSH